MRADKGPLIYAFDLTDPNALKAFADNNHTDRELRGAPLQVDVNSWQEAREFCKLACVKAQRTIVLYWQKPWVNGKTVTFRSMFEPRTSIHMPTTIQVDSQGRTWNTSHVAEETDKGRIMIPVEGIDGMLTMDESSNKVELPSNWESREGSFGFRGAIETEYTTSYNLLTTNEEQGKRRRPKKPRRNNPNK